MNQLLLSLQDVNQIIKHFAFHIQIRIEQIDNKKGIFSANTEYRQNYSKDSIVDKILDKYSQYSSSNSLEIKIIKKFVERITQIFEFFKEKQKKFSQNLLYLIQNRIKQKLQTFVQKEVIQIGEVLQFVVSLTKTYTFMQLIKFHNFRKPLKIRRIPLKSCMTSIKIGAFPQNRDLEDRCIAKRIQQSQRKNQATMQKEVVAKSHINFEPVRGKSDKQNTRIRPLTTKNSKSKQKRPESSQGAFKHARKNSFNKKTDRIFQKFQTQQNSQKMIDYDKLYVDMNIDRRALVKMLEKRQLVLKSMQKRNQKILAKMKKQSNQRMQQSNINICQSQINQQRTQEKQPLKQNHRNLISSNLNHVNKKQPLRLMAYQHYCQKKKKKAQQITYKRNNCNALLIQDKQNFISIKQAQQ